MTTLALQTVMLSVELLHHLYADECAKALHQPARKQGRAHARLFLLSSSSTVSDAARPYPQFVLPRSSSGQGSPLPALVNADVLDLEGCDLYIRDDVTDRSIRSIVRATSLVDNSLHRCGDTRRSKEPLWNHNDVIRMDEVVELDRNRFLLPIDHS